MPERLRDLVDFRVNVTTVGAILLAAISLGMYVQTQESRILATEKAVANLDTERKEQGLEVRRLTVQIEGMRVQLDLLQRTLDREDR